MQRILSRPVTAGKRRPRSSSSAKQPTIKSRGRSSSSTKCPRSTRTELLRRARTSNVPGRSSMTRDELCEAVTRPRSSALKKSRKPSFKKERQYVRQESAADKERYFLPGNDMTDVEKKFCRCVLHVGSSSAGYNPYAVCNASVKGPHRRNCAENYNYNHFTNEELKTFARGHKGVQIPRPFNRDAILYNIEGYLRSKGF